MKWDVQAYLKRDLGSAERGMYTWDRNKMGHN